jgi:hypothetical protein
VELKDHLSELKGGSVWCREGEMTARLGFNRAEDVGRTASFVLAVSFGEMAGTVRLRGANLGMEGLGDRHIYEKMWRERIRL